MFAAIADSRRSRRTAAVLQCAIAAGALSLLASAITNARALGADEADDAALRAAVVQAMRKAADYYCGQVARDGGYVYHYTLDLQTRWGEGLAREHEIWVQPPGTPTVGLALLAAHRATGDAFYLDAAREAAESLAFGQLRSGGWTNKVDLASRSQGRRFQGGDQRRDGNSSLDDGQTQAALLMMVRADEALGFKHAALHESALLGVKSLLAAQFPNGGFPQVWTEPVRPQPANLRASYPDYDWRTEGKIKEYWDMYTLNDNVCGYVVETLAESHRIYRSQACLDAIRRLGDFLVLAQLPDPQPAWAQQYNYRMQPIWARRFEPAAVAADESQEIIETLIRIAELTGDKRYLEPIPRALSYLSKSRLPDGQLARYYELRTNRPLYMERGAGKEYRLTYDDSNLPAHYGWKWPCRVEQLEAAWRRATAGQPAPQPTMSELRQEAERIVAGLDGEGRWVSVYAGGDRLVGQPKFAPGATYLSSAVFSDHLEALAAYLSFK
ncbi:MAG: pectic acid lyase [Planctomycetales bacterium]|nr:pectic acid lyase [Planctomycetales bacterium]